MYRGIGNEFRVFSQLKLMVRLRDQYNIRSVLNAPYDHATDPEVDNEPFSKWRAWVDANPEHPHVQSGEPYDLVWNFDFVQRHPSVLTDMIQITDKYVLAFTPNRYNGGQLIHSLYHKIHKDKCLHPERGNPTFMTRAGLEALFRAHDLKILESNTLDHAPWPDYAVSLGVFFSSPKTSVGTDIYRNTPHLPMPKQLLAFEELIKPFAFTWGHHIYCLGEK